MPGADFDIHIEHEADRYTIPSKKGMTRANQMTEIHKIITSAGWLDKSPDGHPKVDLDEVEPEEELSPAQWKAAVKAKRQEILTEKNKSIPAKTAGQAQKDPNQNDVKVIDRSYLDQSFKAKSKTAQSQIDGVVNSKEFQLNTDQERAFRIVANHAVSSNPDQLKMYMGGMAGTGKSQVIKALMHFFRLRNESHRFAVLAPTGTAAALLNGSTYHSFLGVAVDGLGMRNEATNVAQVQERIEGVDYFFLDEISMVACHEFYKISSQLAKATNQFDLPFGGKNMIFSGDFAQLPPVFGSALYSGDVGTQLKSRMSVIGQESAIGKALWHQVTTVVILRDNMRQRSQTPADAKMRTALENMRYSACTPEDISFLKTRIAGRHPDQPKLAAKDFRNASIITSLNAQKDKINELGSRRFAAETNQSLTHFHSVDHFGNSPDVSEKKRRGRKSKRTSKHSSSAISPWLQDLIWNLPHAATAHFPGRLSLCIGMPVMIRNNDATELCITKGQEGFVAGWTSHNGGHGKEVLDTLFVKLDKPAKSVKIDGLPENVVPIVKSLKTVKCIFPSDLAEHVERSQVWVLPNFSMTDYASQGKTRPFNPVDLSNCRNHQSYYTCLSRSATAAGTIIVQSFSPQMIISGATGYLRQEFCELEILDEITKMRYENTFPAKVQGSTRNSLIRSFQKWKGTIYVPPSIHKALTWSAKDPLPLLSVVTDASWQMISKDKKKKVVENDSEEAQTSFVPAKGSIPVNVKYKLANEETSGTFKEQRTLRSHGTSASSPAGLLWDGEDYSCAYDALITVLYDTWTNNTDH